MPNGVRHFRVRNYERFQHYKERLPPWIKLHYTILDNYEIYSLDDATKWHIVAIWLLASRHNNRLPFDPAWIGHRINAQTPVDLDRLISLDFIEEIDDSILLASLKQDRLSETETETEADPPTVPQGQHFEAWWHVYPKKVKKQPSLVKWKAKRLDRIATTLINDVLTRIEKDGRWMAGYVPDPTTYLNQERWNDELTPPDRASGNSGRQGLSPVERVQRAAKEREALRRVEPSPERERLGGDVDDHGGGLRKPVDIMAGKPR